jgi:hypothetical protein
VTTFALLADIISTHGAVALLWYASWVGLSLYRGEEP